MLFVFMLIVIVVLILMIVCYKIYLFLVLIIVLFGFGFVVGMLMDKIVKLFEMGIGGMFGYIVIVVGFGMMFGKMMVELGGVEWIVIMLIDWFGEKNIYWVMMFVVIIVGLLVFFEVGFVLLILIVFNVVKCIGKLLFVVGLLMVVGLLVVYGLILLYLVVLLVV